MTFLAVTIKTISSVKCPFTNNDGIDPGVNINIALFISSQYNLI